jgi:hypothetical protein
VGVDVQGHGHGRVAKAFTNDLRVDAGLEGEGGVSVAQVVEPDPGQPGALEVPVEQPPDVLGVQQCAVGTGEDQVTGGPGGTAASRSAA